MAEELAQGSPAGSVEMSVERVLYHLVVNTVSDDPLVRWVLDFHFVNELCFKVVTVLIDKVQGVLCEGGHPAQMYVCLLVLAECILILALLLAHLAVVLVLSKGHFC
jgi:hypothetical protein